MRIDPKYRDQNCIFAIYILLNIQFPKLSTFLSFNKETKSMFGNYFFSLFFVSKNNFIFLRLKNLFGNVKWTENKDYFQNSICEENWKYAKNYFQFLIFKNQ